MEFHWFSRHVNCNRISRARRPSDCPVPVPREQWARAKPHHLLHAMDEVVRLKSRFVSSRPDEGSAGHKVSLWIEYIHQTQRSGMIWFRVLRRFV